jgi:electron transfer flavoprotein alpha subunit
MILAIAEQRDGVLNRSSWELIAAAQAMGGPLTVVLPGAGIAGVAEEFRNAAIAEVVVLDDEGLREYTADGYTQALAAFIAAEPPQYVAFAHSYQTRDYAPKLAARFDRSVISDCVRVSEAGGRMTFTRPMFQGKLHADVRTEGPGPHFVSFQSGAFRADSVRNGTSPSSIRSAAVTLDRSAIRQRVEPPFREARQAVDLSQAERIVAVGRGVKGQEHLALVESLARALGAEVAASRPICDAGWLPMERQVGSSGQTVAPKLYVALGISGAIQHVVGMKGSKTIVAINKDGEAPIFEIADYGVQGDLFEIVPAMIEALQGRG